MVTQIKILYILLFAILMTMLLTQNEWHKNIVFQLISQTSTLILKNQTFSFQGQVLRQYSDYAQLLFNKDTTVIRSINNLYNHLILFDYNVTVPIYCAGSETNYSYNNIDAVCLAVINSSDHSIDTKLKVDNQFMKAMSILDTLLFEIDVTKQIFDGFYIALDGTNLGAWWPQAPAASGANDQHRPWYLGSKSAYLGLKQDFYITDLYQFTQYDSQVMTINGITFTQALLNGSRFQGVIGTDINFSVIQRLIKNYFDLNIILVYKDGSLLFQNTFLIPKSEQFLFIYNQTITGFDQEAWDLMYATASGTGQLEIYNQVLHKSIDISISKIYGYPFYLIVFNNLLYEEQQISINQNFIESLGIQFKAQMWIIIPGVFSCLLLSLYFIQKLLQPIKDIKALIIKHRVKQKFCIDKSNKNTLYKLQNTICKIHNKMQRLSLVKHQLCRNIERFKYYRIQTYLNNINQIQKLIDYDDPIMCPDFIKNQLHEFIQAQLT